MKRKTKEIKQTFFYASGNILGKLAGVVLLPLYTHQLNVQDFGVIAVLDTLLQILVTVLSFGLSNSLERWYVDNEHQASRKHLFSTITIFILLANILLLPIAYVYRDSISQLLLNDRSYGYTLWLVVLMIPFEIVFLLTQTVFKMEQKAIQYSIGFVLKIAVSLAMIVFFVVNKKLGINSIYYGGLVGYAVYILYAIPSLWPVVHFKMNTKLLKGMMSFGYPFMFTSISLMFTTMADFYILGHLSGLGEVGVYSLALRISNLVKVIIIGSIQLTLIPILYKKLNDPDAKDYYANLLPYYSFVVLLFLLITSCFGKYITWILAGDIISYGDAINIIPIISLSIFLYAVKDMFGLGLNIAKKTTLLIVALIASSIVNVLADLLFCYYYGSAGIAIASVVSQAVYVLMLLFYSRKYYTIPFRFTPFNGLWMLSIIAYLISRVSFDNIVVDIAYKTLIVIAYGGTCFMLKWVQMDYFLQYMPIGMIKRVVNLLKGNRTQAEKE